ncbi:MAG: hypothetical protein FJX71_04185 [Alphaproteobacteria bacterium]|nr:hypothetical protein [Alphaproteobacteria bacterium]
MKINKKSYLLFITSTLLSSIPITAAQLEERPYDFGRNLGGGYYRQAPAGTLGVYRLGNEEFIPYEDSRGATGAYVRAVPLGVHTSTSDSQGTPILVAAPESPRLRDPAIRYFTPQTVKMRPEHIEELKSHDNFAEELYNCNYLDLSNFKLSTSTLADFLSQADLSTVREINLSCSSEHATTYDADGFLAKLLTNGTLRSLAKIDASGSNITHTTLEILRTKSDLREPIIRDIWKLHEESGKKVATIEVKIQNTPVASLDGLSRRKLQLPGDSRFSILYRNDDYFPGSAAHIQLLLK